jgi:hypothetical protein
MPLLLFLRLGGGENTSLFHWLIFIPSSLQLIAQNTSKKSIKTLRGPATTAQQLVELGESLLQHH